MTLVAALDLENNAIEEFTIVGDASIVTSPVLSGTYALKTTNALFGSFLYYTHVSENIFGDETYMHCLWEPTTAGATRTVMFIYDGNTANPCAEVLLISGKLEVHVYTGITRAGDESDTGTTALSLGTTYRLELQYIKSNGNSKGYVELKLNGTTEASVEHSTSVGYDQNLRVAWGRGRHIGFGGANQHYSDMWANNGDGSENTSWPGNLTFTRLRPSSDGNYDLWRGVSDDTDHYKNVDEADVSDADFVVDDKDGNENKQTFGLTSISTGKVIRGIKTMIRRKSASATLTANLMVVRESSTDYTKDVDNSLDDITAWEYAPFQTTTGPSDLGPQYWDTLPSGGALTNAAVSALEIGGESNLGTGIVPIAVPTSDDQQQWTRSAGADNYALIDEGVSTPDDSDYIESSTSGEEDRYLVDTMTDSEGYLFGSPPIRVAFRAKLSAGSASEIEAYIKIGGTWYASDDSVSISSGSFAFFTDDLAWALDPRDSGQWFSEDAPDFEGFGFKHLDSNGTVQISVAEIKVGFRPTLRISQTSIMAVHDDVDEVVATIANRIFRAEQAIPTLTLPPMAIMKTIPAAVAVVVRRIFIT